LERRGTERKSFAEREREGSFSFIREIFFFGQREREVFPGKKSLKRGKEKKKKGKKGENPLSSSL
jgi:hypothetical protein